MQEVLRMLVAMNKWERYQVANSYPNTEDYKEYIDVYFGSLLSSAFGHTIEHTGRDDEFLKNRLRRDRRLSGATVFDGTREEVAELIRKYVLMDEYCSSELCLWRIVHDGNDDVCHPGTHLIPVQCPHVIGHGYVRNHDWSLGPEETDKMLVLFRRHPCGFSIVTAYPVITDVQVEDAYE